MFSDFHGRYTQQSADNPDSKWVEGYYGLLKNWDSEWEKL